MTSEMTPDRAAFEKLEVGVPVGPTVRLLDAETVRRYADSLGTGNPWFVKDSPFGGPIVPPCILENIAADLGNRALSQLETKGGGLFAGIEVEYLKPVPVGTTVTVLGRVADKYIRRDKYYLVTEFHVQDEAGTEVMTGRVLQARLPSPEQARWQ